MKDERKEGKKIQFNVKEKKADKNEEKEGEEGDGRKSKRETYLNEMSKE